MKTVALKELTEALRDRRALLSSVFYCLMGPAVVWMVSLAMPGKGSDALIGMISVFTLVAAFSGGMNVAMDVIAGERERKSLVPLLCNPVSRLDVLLGKWLAVAAFSAGGVLLCLLGFGFVYTPGSLAGLEVMLLTGMLPLALLAAAIELAVSTACRSSKEAQSYLSMVVFVPMVLGIFAVFFPGSLAGIRDVLPLAGQQAQIETWLRHGSPALAPSVVLGTLTAVFAAAIVLGAARILESDDAVYGS